MFYRRKSFQILVRQKVARSIQSGMLFDTKITDNVAKYGRVMWKHSVKTTECLYVSGCVCARPFSCLTIGPCCWSPYSRNVAAECVARTYRVTHSLFNLSFHLRPNICAICYTAAAIQERMLFPSDSFKSLL
jgi:hypothetical protein